MSQPGSETRTLNLRALLILLAATVVLGGTAYATHRFQVKRNARGLLAQADQAEHEGRLSQAADYVWQYLGLVPRDDAALARYGLLLARQGGSSRARLRALLLCDHALRRDPDRLDVRRVAAGLAIELGLIKEGRHHLDELTRLGGDEGSLLLMRARLEARAREFEASADAYSRAVARAPADVPAWREYLAVVRDGLRDEVRADGLVEALLAANPRSAQARLVAIRYFLAAAAPHRAEEHLRQALAGPGAKDEETLLLAAEAALSRGQTEPARQHLLRGLQLHPGSAPLRLAAARLEGRAGRRREALAHLAPLRRALPERLEQRWELGRLLAELGERTAAEEALRGLPGREGQWARDLLRGLLLARNKAWGEARVLLERLRKVPLTTALGPQVDALLADCYLAQGSPDQAADAARQALAAQPGSPAAAIRLAEALAGAGKTEEALRIYRRLAGLDPGLRLRLARLLLASQLRLPQKERDCKELEKVLDAVPEERRRDTEVLLLRAEVLAAQGRTDDARRLAERARDQAPQDAGPWLALAELAGRRGGEHYLAVVDEAQRRAGRRIEWVLARLRHWTRTGGKKALEQVQALAGELGSWPAEDAGQLAISLGSALVQLGDEAAALALWREAARLRPDDLASRLLLLEGAAAANRLDEARRLASEIEQKEGGGGPLGCYARAVAATLAARQGDRAALAPARRELNRAAVLRPSWARVHALQGDVEAMRGRREEAVKLYQRALQRGEVRLRVWRHLAELLFDLRRYGEALALLRRLPEENRLRGRLGQLSASLALVDPDEAADAPARRKKALEMARQVVRAGSGGYRDHLWLGQLAWLAGERQEAERALRQARQLAPAEPATWVALVAVVAQLDRERARGEAAEAAKALKPGKDALAVLACHELAGQDREARQLAEQALRDQPGEPRVLAEVAAFHVRNGRPEQAEPLWRQVLAARTKAPAALARACRRVLAVQLALKMSYPAYKEALTLIEKNLEKGNAVEDRRVKAVVLATRPAQRAEAIRLLAALPPQAASTPQLQLLLARLYEANGRWPLARRCLLALAQADEKNIQHVGQAIQGLLRHGEVEEARRLFGQLEEAARQTPEGVELAARLLHADGHKAQALALLEKYRGGEVERLAPVAHLLEGLGEDEAAEKLLRRLAANPRRVEGRLLLARHLARRRRAEEALRLCDGAWGTARDEDVAVLSLTVLRAGGATARQRAQVAQKVRAALARRGDSAGLLLSLAELEESDGRHDQALALYRRALQVEPGNVMALNNLSYLLTVKEDKHAEALELVNELLEAVGPVAEVLDTRGLIHLGAGRPQQARKDFLAALEQDPSAVKLFHLAWAHQAADERREAQQALARARSKGLKEETLPPLERAAFRKLASEVSGD